MEKAIYKSAKYAFLKLGYHGTTMEIVAWYAGSGKASVHYYFRSKEKLFLLVFSDYFRQLYKYLQCVSEDITPQSTKNNTSDLSEIAWFIVNELKTNPKLALKAIQDSNGITSICLSIIDTAHLLDNLQKLISIQVNDISDILKIDQND